MTHRRWILAGVAIVTTSCTSGASTANPSTTEIADESPAMEIPSNSTVVDDSLAVVDGAATTEPTVDEPETTTVPVAVESEVDVDVTLPEGEAETLGPLGSTDREIETDDGLVDIGDAELPASLPEEFPVPDDFEVQLATDVGDQSGFSGVTALELAELADFYRTALEVQGYTVDEIQSIDGVLVVLGFDGEGGRGEVALSSAPGGGRSVLVTFSA